MGCKMGMRTTLLLSFLIHGIFFSAVLILSAGLTGGPRAVPLEHVIFVDLLEDREPARTQRAAPVREAVLPAVAKPFQKKARPVRKQEEKTGQQLNKAGDGGDEGKQNDALTEEEVHREAEVSASLDAEESRSLGTGTVRTDERDIVHSERLGGYDKATASVDLDGAQAEGVSPGKGSDGLNADIIAVIAGAIERAKTYPLIARRRGLEGTVHVRFLINPRGEPQEIEILKSSGHGILDSATVKVVRRAAPYPPVDRRVEVPVAYRLRD